MALYNKIPALMWATCDTAPTVACFW